MSCRLSLHVSSGAPGGEQATNRVLYYLYRQACGKVTRAKGEE